MPRKRSDEHCQDLHHVPPELDKLAALIGTFIRYWGFKDIHGRLWTHLYLSPKPLDAGVLRKRLRASKALISISLKELQEYDVVREHTSKTAHGTQAFVANPRVLEVIFNVLRQRELSLMANVMEANAQLAHFSSAQAQESNIDKERVGLLARFIESGYGTLKLFMDLGAVDFKNWDKVPFK
jgi:DNA-binding transcriptional regulator GbsR (MarR family)